MKRLVVVCAIAAVVVSLLSAAQLSFLVLNPQAFRLGATLPDGWQVHVSRGKPEIAVVADNGQNVLRLQSHSSSYGVERGFDVDPRQMPVLAWKWKVSQLPKGGDFRRSATDDQAAQVIVAFADRHILNYIWDTTAPAGLMQSASFIPLVHIYDIVARSGDQMLNQWIAEAHNLAQDYQRAWGRPAPHIKGIRLQINTQHTGTSAESFFGDIEFRTASE